MVSCPPRRDERRGRSRHGERRASAGGVRWRLCVVRSGNGLWANALVRPRRALPLHRPREGRRILSNPPNPLAPLRTSLLCLCSPRPPRPRGHDVLLMLLVLLGWSPTHTCPLSHAAFLTGSARPGGAIPRKDVRRRRFLFGFDQFGSPPSAGARVPARRCSKGKKETYRGWDRGRVARGVADTGTREAPPCVLGGRAERLTRRDALLVAGYRATHRTSGSRS